VYLKGIFARGDCTFYSESKLLDSVKYKIRAVAMKRKNVIKIQQVTYTAIVSKGYFLTQYQSKADGKSLRC
jgi:hypothetical protein